MCLRRLGRELGHQVYYAGLSEANDKSIKDVEVRQEGTSDGWMVGGQIKDKERTLPFRLPVIHG